MSIVKDLKIQDNTMSLHFFHAAYYSCLSFAEGALRVPSTKPNLDFAFKEITMAHAKSKNCLQLEVLKQGPFGDGQNDGENKKY